MKADSPDDSSQDIRVFTLNCWGLKCVSAKRKERMEAIGTYLANSDYDIVLLEEVWTTEDFERIRQAVQDTYPFYHFFDNGIIGSGTCIFTRAQIRDATFHEFTMNGYPHKIWHGDWFGGKGLGVCQIFYKGYDIHIYISHYHAEYNRMNDVYLGHRVIHALESAQWIKLASSSADLTIYGGDFNTEPTDVPYKLLKYLTPLLDSWEEVHGIEGGESCDAPANSFCNQSLLERYPDGKRIDYIMFQPGPNVQAEATSCTLPLPNRVPNKNYSYSDHEAVSATIRISKDTQSFRSAPEYKRHMSLKCRHDTLSAVKESKKIIEKSKRHVDWDGMFFTILCVSLLIVLILSFIPIAVLDKDYHAYVEVGLFIPRFLLSMAIILSGLMATLFNKRERNSLNSALNALQLIEKQDFGLEAV